MYVANRSSRNPVVIITIIIIIVVLLLLLLLLLMTTTNISFPHTVMSFTDGTQTLYISVRSLTRARWTA